MRFLGCLLLGHQWADLARPDATTPTILRRCNRCGTYRRTA